MQRISGQHIPEGINNEKGSVVLIELKVIFYSIEKLS
jgi:hypothetical protein